MHPIRRDCETKCDRGMYYPDVCNCASYCALRMQDFARQIREFEPSRRRIARENRISEWVKKIVEK